MASSSLRCCSATAPRASRSFDSPTGISLSRDCSVWRPGTATSGPKTDPGPSGLALALMWDPWSTGSGDSAAVPEPDLARFLQALVAEVVAATP